MCTLWCFNQQNIGIWPMNILLLRAYTGTYHDQQDEMGVSESNDDKSFLDRQRPAARRGFVGFRCQTIGVCTSRDKMCGQVLWKLETTNRQKFKDIWSMLVSFMVPKNIWFFLRHWFRKPDWSVTAMGVRESYTSWWFQRVLNRWWIDFLSGPNGCESLCGYESKTP